MKPLAAALILGSMALAMPVLAQAPSTFPAGDAAKGKTTFTQVCAVCHTAKSGPLGPTLTGVYGRKAGSAADFAYSRGMTASGITWDDAKLDAYLAAPTKVITGGKMAINVAKPADRANVITYLKTLK